MEDAIFGYNTGRSESARYPRQNILQYLLFLIISNVLKRNVGFQLIIKIAVYAYYKCNGLCSNFELWVVGEKPTHYGKFLTTFLLTITSVIIAVTTGKSMF